MRMMDFAPLSRSSVGFDRLFDMLESATTSRSTANYPPYNIEKTGEDTYRITLATAGFVSDELSLTAVPNQLIVAGKKAQTADGHFLYRGIANRAFQRRFNLADHVHVRGATLKDGMLSIDLAREVPAAMKPRRIEIANSNLAPIESNVAA